MRIAHFTDSFLPSINGVATSLANLARSIAGPEHSLKVFAPRSSLVRSSLVGARDDGALPPGLSVERCASLPTPLYPDFRFSVPTSRRLFRKLEAFDPDVVHVHTAFALGALGIRWAKRLNKPVVGTFHTYFMEPEYLDIVGLTRYARRVSSWLWEYAKYFYNHCDLVTAPSHFARADLVARGIKRPVRCLSNTLSHTNVREVHRQTIERLRKRYELGKRVVVYVGRVSREKSLEILVDSFEDVARSDADSYLLIVGDGPASRALRRLVGRRERLRRIVKFTGQIEHSDLLSSGYYQLGDVFATASTSENQPVSIIEAMRFGLPIVALKGRGMTEMVEKVGIVCNSPAEMSNAIERVLSCRETSTRLRARSRQRYESTFAPELISRHCLALYEKAIAGTTQRSQA